MRKALFALIALLYVAIANSQVSNYVFSQSTGTYTPIAGTVLHASGWDDEVASATIPFSFTFNGTAYTTVSVNSNGYVTFGATTSGTTNYIPISSTAGYSAAIAAFARDMVSNSTTVVTGVTGSAPNQKFIIQWNNARRYSLGAITGDVINFQIVLNETSNIINVNYGTCTATSSISLTHQVGLRGATNSDFNNRSTTTNWSATTAGGVNTATCTSTNVIMPPSGLTFTWTPPPLCTGTPLTPTVLATTGFCLPSGSVSITAGNLTTGVTGITYQWEESDDNGAGDPWVNAVGGSGATTSTYTSPVLSATIYYRIVTTCTNGGATATSSATQVNPVNCTFNITRSAATYSSVAGTGTSATGWRNGNNTDDNMSTAQPIGFTFNYKGVDYSQFLVSTSGFITFNTGTAALGNGLGAYGYDNVNFSSTTGTLNALAPFYEDQVTPGNPTTAAGLANAMKYEVTGSLPNRVLTVEWIGMETFNNAGPNLNYQVKLYETTNVVEFVYGTMELFNGTANYGYGYTVGVNAPTISASPTIAQLQTQQVDNAQDFANVAKNNLDRFIDCNIKYTFTPGTYSGPVAPPTLVNDEPAGSVTLAVNSSPCTSLCGTYYTTNMATASAGIATCGAGSPGTPDDDVWFKFTATVAQQTITVRGGGGFDPVVQLFSDAGITPVTCVNATGIGLSETINATTLTPGNVYYIQVYHAGAGSNIAGAGTGNTTTGGVPDFAICVNEVVLPPLNDNPCGAHPLTVNNGSCNPYQDNVIGGKTQFITATTTVLNGVVTPTCSGAATVQDVWFSFVAPNCNSMVIKTIPVAGVNTAFEVDSVASGTCGGADLILGVKSCTNIASTAQADSLIFTSFVPGNTYYVRVYHHPGGQGGAPVSGSQFSICLYTPPIPLCTTNISPANAATNVSGTPTLTWTAALGATSYDVYLDTNNPPTTLAATVPGTSYAVTPALSYNTQYYWYVVPKNCAGNATGCSSSTTSFTTTNPPPSNDECSGAITVTTQPNAPTCSGTTSVNTTAATLSTNTSNCWSTSNNDDVWYRFVATSTAVFINVSNFVVTSGTGTDLAYVIYNDTLDCNNVNSDHELTSFACPVVAVGSGSGTASFSGLIVGNTYTLRLFVSGTANSASFDFCLMDPPVPPICTTNLTPANGATNQTVPLTLSWNAAATATSYTVFLGTNNPPVPATDSLTTVSGTSFVVNNLASNTTYYWFVTPKNTGGGASGCDVNTTSFTTGLIYCIPAYSNNICSSGDSLVYFTLKGENSTQISNASGGSCGASSPNYSDYTAMGSVDMYPSKTYSGKLKVNPGFSEGVTMWIDFDDDGLFESAEKVLNHLTVAPSDGELLYGIYIPIGSTPGSHRLRVRTVFGNVGGNIDPCSSYGFGETEDYTVNILGGPVTPYVVSAPPVPGTCVTGTVMTLNSLSNNNNAVIPILDSNNNIIASVNALNESLNRVTTEYYVHNSSNGTNTRTGPMATGAPVAPVFYMDRNLRISVGTQPASPVNVRMYLTAGELANFNVAAPVTTVGLLEIHKTNQNTCAIVAAGDSSQITQAGSGTLGGNYFVDFSSPSFSNFFLFKQGAVLPVSVVNFYGRVTGASNTFYWTTLQEHDNRKFVIERSQNGRDFTPVGEQPTQAVNGTSNAPLHYSFVDIAPFNGKSFYRLRMVDLNARETTSPIVTLLRGKGNFELVDIRPNPTNGVIYFNVIGGSNNITVVLRNIDGREVIRRKFEGNSSGYSFDISNAANGMYMLEAIDASGTKATIKIVKQ